MPLHHQRCFRSFRMASLAEVDISNAIVLRMVWMWKRLASLGARRPDGAVSAVVGSTVANIPCADKHRWLGPANRGLSEFLSKNSLMDGRRPREPSRVSMRRRESWTAGKLLAHSRVCEGGL